jgi:hypothetical protein
MDGESGEVHGPRAATGRGAPPGDTDVILVEATGGVNGGSPPFAGASALGSPVAARLRQCAKEPTSQIVQDRLVPRTCSAGSAQHQERLSASGL